MDPKLSGHMTRVRQLREAFARANERLVARLRAADADAAERAPGGGWSAAQIGWHVAAVTNRFAGLIGDEGAGAQPLPDGFRERSWEEVAASIPVRLTAPPSAVPPQAVSRDEAISLLEASGMRMARAFDRLTPERGGTMGITHRVTGTITVYQVGDWATAHVIRHNRQAKQVLGR